MKIAGCLGIQRKARTEGGKLQHAKNSMHMNKLKIMKKTPSGRDMEVILESNTPMGLEISLDKSPGGIILQDPFEEQEQ